MRAEPSESCGLALSRCIGPGISLGRWRTRSASTSGSSSTRRRRRTRGAPLHSGADPRVAAAPSGGVKKAISLGRRRSRRERSFVVFAAICVADLPRRCRRLVSVIVGSRESRVGSIGSSTKSVRLNLYHFILPQWNGRRMMQQKRKRTSPFMSHIWRTGHQAHRGPSRPGCCRSMGPKTPNRRH